MKTINDLVDKLNNYVAYGEYRIAKGKNENYLLWFDEPEKKYNIIIGEDVGTSWKAAYQKTSIGIEVHCWNKENSLTSDSFIFTESEIEDLKSKVSEHSAKIIDIAKVEVKDD